VLYAVRCRRCLPARPAPPLNPLRENDSRPSSRPGRRRNINPLPIGYGSRPRLRGPANPARINLAQEPLDFRRQRFSRCLSLLMSAFALPIPPRRFAPPLRWPTERSATASGVRNQESGVRMNATNWRRDLQHPADLNVVGHPPPSHDFLDIAEIDAVAQPQLR